MVTYGTTADIPKDQITVLEGGTVAVSVAFENSMVVVGGMDTANGSATPGNVIAVESPSDAQTLFGDGSELHEQSQLAFQNGVGSLYMMPVAETTTTETFGSSTATDSGTLSNVPFMDPSVHGEHDVTAQDVTEGTSVTVNVVYVDGSPSAPTSSNEINLDYITGQWTADETSEYDITYTYGDYSASALQPAVDQATRMVAVCTEHESVVNDLASELNSNAQNFTFSHGIAGATPKEDGVQTNTYATNYSDGVDERRISLVSPSRGYVDAAETNAVRTVGAVGGYLASLPLGVSATADSLGGFTGLRSELTPQDAGDLIDKQVMPLIDYPPVEIVSDMTTSTTQKFERVYTNQVVDEATELSHQISREFVGEQNTETQRRLLARSHKNAFGTMENGTPPQLDDYTVSVSEDNSDPNKTNVNVALDVVDVMDLIDVTMTVGDIVRNGGAT